MKLLTLVSAVFIGLSAATVNAQNFYVCDNGDDANDGLSESSPIKSFSKALAKFNTMSAGGSVSFCRGGVFDVTVQDRIKNSNCSADAMCRLGDYGSLVDSAPVILAHTVTPFNFQNGGSADTDGGYLVENLKIVSSTGTGTGIFLYNDVNDVIIDNVTIDGFSGGVYSAGANAAKGAWVNRANDRIILRNSTIINNKKMGWLGGCNDCLIENNHFENNGSKEVFDHNIYIDSPVKDQSFVNSGITIRGNTLTKSNMVDGKCSGTSLVVHGIIENLTIDNNIIKEDVGQVIANCWGIQVDPGNELDESFKGVTITNNKLYNVGNTGIACASCSDVLISGNEIIDEGYILRAGISVPHKTNEDSHKSENIVIENNKIALSHEWGIGIALSGDNQFSARHNMISLDEADKNAKCFTLSGANTDTDVTNNTCLTHNDVSSISFDDTSTSATDSGSSTTTTDSGSSTTTTDSGSSTTTTDSGSSTTTTDSGSSTTTTDSGSSTTTTDSGSSTTTTDSGSSTTTTDSGSSTTTTDSGTTTTTTDSGTTTTYKTKSNKGKAKGNTKLGTESGSSSSGDLVTWDDVNSATDITTDVDPSTCRAVANGKCIMK